MAGYPAMAGPFVSIEWTGNDGGFIVDAAGAKTPFLNDGIGKIIYFDQAYYESVDHNQYWVDWRLGIQSHEVVVPPVDTVGLQPGDMSHLQSEQAVLDDIVGRYPQSQTVLAPTRALLKEDIANLANGLVLQNGKWLSPKDLGATPGAQVVGEANKLVTFTTKDGKKYVNATAVVSDTGVSLLTPDGGATVPFDKLPDDLSPFPATIRGQIQAVQAKARADAAAAAAALAPPAPSLSTGKPTTGLLDQVEAFVMGCYQKVLSYFSSSSTTSVPAATGSPTPDAGGPDIASSVVLIKGDTMQGTGFLTKTADGPVVITNIHVIAGNTNMKIFTAGGEQIAPLSLKGASDRDLAMFSIEDHHYTYLDLASNVDETAAVGDPTLIPGDSEGGEVTLKTNGSLVAVGPQRVEFNNPIYHGNSGGPVYDSKSQKVIAVVVGASSMAPTNEVDKDSFANANSAIKGPMRYFGLRLDTVPSWEPYSLDQLIQETLFLNQFHEQSRALDSFINGTGYEHANIASEEGPPDSKYFLRNDKVRKIAEDFHHTEESEGQVTALQELIWALETEVNDGFDTVQNNHRFYPYNRPLAQREFEYRKALKDELQDFQSKVQSMTPNASSSIKL
jgi:S1-C subfamily serine protease